MHFVLQPPSLQRLAAIKIVTELWNLPTISIQITALIEGVKAEVAMRKQVFRDAMKAIILGLELPEPCKQQMLPMIRPLGNEILDWCAYHVLDKDYNNGFPFLPCSLPKQFSWTMHGIVDYAKTAKSMVKDEELSIEKRYEMACMSCLEDEARELFPLLAEERIREYMNTPIKIERKGHHDLVVYFSCILSAVQPVQEMRRTVTQSINLYEFIITLFSSNRRTYDYFFNRLNQQEKEYAFGDMSSMVFGNVKRVYHCNLLVYLSMMSEEQRESLFRARIRKVLEGLYRWPTHCLVLETLERYGRYASERVREYVRVALNRYQASTGS